jgi:hypothetical protein
LLHAFMDDVDQVSLHVFQGHALHESRNVNILRFEVVQQIGETVKCPEL